MDTLDYREGYGALVTEAVAQREELEQARAKLRDLELVNAWLLDEVSAQAKLREAADASEARFAVWVGGVWKAPEGVKLETFKAWSRNKPLMEVVE